MRTQASKEGYLLIDNRNSPGVSAEFVQQAGVDTPAVGAGQRLEMKTITCSHCATVFIVNPQRKRERHFCTGCDHYICDICAGVRQANGGECRTFNEIADEYRNAIEKGASVNQALLVLRGTVLDPLSNRGV